jgi:uncharacterized repeat protein (TIGR03806 family)
MLEPQALADYIGNPLVSTSAGADGLPPVAILGEYGGSPAAKPGPGSTLSFPVNGTVNDIKIYNASAGKTFAVFTVRPSGLDGSGNQLFLFVNGQTFTSGSSVGIETFTPSGTWQVQAGDLIAYWGYVAPYSYPTYKDATYQNDGLYTATIPTAGQTYSFGKNGSGTAYQYLTNANYGPGRQYSVGVDYTPFNVASSLAVLSNLLATGVQAFSATLNGQVVSNGGGAPPGVTLYYGATDGGTNSAAWANTIPLGAMNGSFSAAVSNLAPGTIYHFTCSASSSVGIAWATPSQTFTTSNYTLAAITNLPATAIQAVTATANGQVLGTGGGPPPLVTVYYGTSDGGTNAASWSNRASLGAQSGQFFAGLAGLASNTTYYFTASASNGVGVAWASPSLSFKTLTNSTLASVLTWHNDNTRAGANTNETQLTLANVNAGSFGKLFSYSVDGQVYAEPLIAANVTIPGQGTHNVLYVVTEHDSIYAFDADTMVSTPYWSKSFINPAGGITTVSASESAEPNIYPESGITATPVIDPASGTIYLEVRTKEIVGGVTSYPHRLHALDMTTGQERSNSPVLIQCTNYPGIGTPGSNDTDGKGHVLWNGLRENCRPALLLANGVVYITFASPGDNPPYYGWIFAYNAQTMQQVGVLNDAPNGGYGGIWSAGCGPAADAKGFVYLNTGNGPFDSTTNNYGDSYLKLAITNNPTNSLALVDYFTPYNQQALANSDIDVGSAGYLVLPDSAGSSNHPHLLLGGSKANTIYLLDRDSMGKYNSANDSQIVQELNGAVGGMWCSPAYFNGMFYIAGSGDSLKSFTISNGVMSASPTAHSATSFGQSTPCISANGVNNAIVWNVEAYSSVGSAVLHAFNATNVSQELYNSTQDQARDNPGSALEYTIPAIVNGKVYVGAQYAVSVYGIGNFLVAPTISPSGEIFTNSVTITINEASSGALIYYTTNGTTPTTNSILYTGPFVTSNSVSITAAAFRSGSVPSGTVSAGFINSATLGNGSGLLGQYWSNTTSTAFTNTSFNTPPTLTRVDPGINFNWDSTPPDPSIGLTVYCVRWTGSVQPQFTDNYTFYASADDGVRLWVNGKLLVDQWHDEAQTAYSGTINLVAQQRYDIEMDFYQNGGQSVAQLSWSSPLTGPAAIIPATQLYPVTNPPPAVEIIGPPSNAVFTASASVTIAAAAASQYNSLQGVSFFVNNKLIGVASNAPYTLTATGLAAGTYTLAAVATDGSGMSSTSAPVNISVTAGTGAAYGMTNRGLAQPFFNMPTTFAGSIPALLSQTGVFTNTSAMSPSAALVPYSPNVALWSDGAVKTRYMGVPNTGGAIAPGQQVGFAPTGAWTFPAGTVFVKTFQLLTNQADPGSLHRLETRLLVRDVNGAVYGVTYKWRGDNSDADLMTSSLTEPIAITTPTGVITQNWYYPSPDDCLMCHTPVANYVLGLNTRQLNATTTYPSGTSDNELRTLNRLGLLNPAINESAISNYEAMPALTNAAATLQNRARAYLDANCAQCHQPGGSGPTIDARYETPLTNQNIINALLVKGTLGADNARVVAPEDVWRSVLYLRINTTNPAVQMPPLARNLIDTNGVAVMAAWINSLPGTPALPPPAITPGGGTFNGFANVSVQAPTNALTVYYTLDGSLPTTNSPIYAGPFMLTNSTTVTASAFAPGFVNSVAATANFAILPGVYFTGPGTFSSNAFNVKWAGLAGKGYILQGSTDFVNWVPLSTNPPGATLFNFSDPGISNLTHRFYRAVQQ